MKERAVIYKHMLPNALIPIITIAGNYFTRCVGGTIVLEKIFSFPGIGLYLTDAISGRDYPVIRGCVIVMAAFTALIMLLVDLAYGFVDPRIKAQYKSGGSHHHRNRQGHGGGGRHHDEEHSKHGRHEQAEAAKGAAGAVEIALGTEGGMSL